MPMFQPPENFNFHRPCEWPEWRQRYGRYSIATQLCKKDDLIQINTLIYVMGKNAEHIFNSFVFDGDDATKFDKVLQKFDEYFLPKKNLIHERARFNSRRQAAGESVETFIRVLYEIAENCDFSDKSERIRDQIVIGILDKELSEKLQLKPELTLDQAAQLVRQTELVKSQVKDQDIQVKHLDEMNRRYSGNGRNRGGSRGRGQGQNKFANNRGRGRKNTSTNQCTKCNRRHGRETQCPAKGQRCNSCNKMDHFAVCCQTFNRGVHEVCRDDSLEDSNSAELFLGSVSSSFSEPWHVNIDICGKPVNFKIDTGADITVISYSTYLSLPSRPRLQPVSIQLGSPGGKLTCKGKFSTTGMYRHLKTTFDIYVIENSYTLRNNLLGRDVACELRLVQRIEEVGEAEPGAFGQLNCSPMKISLRDNAVPYCLSVPRRIPFPIMKQVELELQRMERDGIIEKVTQPTEWCAPMVPVPKKNGQVRICVDLKKLNEVVKRENFMLPNLDDIAPKLVGATCFSKLDAASGFYQIPLDDASSILTTFITPFERFCFRRVPFGISCAPEVFQREMSRLVQGLEGVEAIMDDILIYGRTVDEHDHRLKLALARIRDSGLKLNKDKCEFRKSRIEYFGHILSKGGISPNPERVRAITELEPPTNVSELRRVMGMINYLGKFVPDLSSVAKPITDLLKSDSSWYWGPGQSAAFNRVKCMLSDVPVLAYYNMSKPIVVSADASSYGLGGALFQQEGDSLQPIAYCSRTLTPSECKYAQIEKECLAGVWACEKFARYLVGLESFTLLTDHKPLVPLINNQDLDKAPLRCQRLLLRLRRFNVQAKYVAGKLMVVPDTLSRSPLNVKSKDEIETCVKLFVDSVMAHMPASDCKLDEIRQATDDDPELQKVINLTKSGWPDHISSVPDGAKQYFNVRNELSVCDRLLLYRSRIVIPRKLREETIDIIHGGHLGINKCRERASQSVWWPSLSSELSERIDNCKFCEVHRPTQRKEPLRVTELPERPWQKISADLCELDGKHYLVVMDYFSRFIEIAHLSSITSEHVIFRLKNIFARWGIPEQFVSDNGPQFTALMFKQFARYYGFSQTFSSPHHPQSNGLAEAGIKIAKRILRQDDIFLALMAYRSTPLSSTGVSPCELLMGRRIRNMLPTDSKNLDPQWPDLNRIRDNDAKAKLRYRNKYNRHNAVKLLEPLKPGDNVRLKLDSDKLWDKIGTVKERVDSGRSYIISTQNGELRRNGRYLRRTNSSLPIVHPKITDTDWELPIVRNTDKSSKSSADVLKLPVPSESLNESSQKPNAQTRTRSGRVVTPPKRFSDFELGST